ncbi:MAG: translocation/assembly module TamB [Gemmatimonadaceae bacterium]|nr:translocation/assembly module TamB [Gemmatimonadaceae bacterium]
MARRRDIALGSAIVIALLLIVGAVGLFGMTRSDGGREWLRRQAERALAASLRGEVHVGKLSGSFLTDLSIDSLEIRDPDDSLFVRSGPMRVAYDPRDLADGRIVIRALDAQRLHVHIRRDSTNTWNFRKLWPPSPGPRLPRPRRAFGSLVWLQNVRITDGEIAMTQSWAPDDSLKGARRDSSIAMNRSLPGREIRPSGSGWLRTYRWGLQTFVVSEARLVDPDSQGQHIEIARWDGVENYPPFTYRNLRGHVEFRGDTATFDFDRFGFAHSAGHAFGRVWWGSDLPTRYDVRVVGDTVAMSDIAWVYPTLPVTGGGRMDLHITNDPKNLRIIRYALTRMDVRSMRSRILGQMTFAVGGPVLHVDDVRAEMAPVNFELLERLNGKRFPYPWRGDLTGTVRATGGPVNRWTLDEARFTFSDANVPGAITRGVARGGLDILFPAFTVFRGLALDIAQLDLRTPQFLNPNFPRVNGLVRGTTVLDSSWLDVRYSQADLTHHDGDAPLSRFRGAGRVTWGPQFMTYDVAMLASPLSVTALARSYPLLPLRGEYSGPISAKGTVENLAITGDLAGDGGRLVADGVVDAYPPLYRATGRWTASALDLRRVLGDSTLPTSGLAFRAVTDVQGDSAANLVGTASVQIDRGVVQGARIETGLAALRFGDGRATVDSARIESSLGTLGVRGALALTATAPRDTLRVVTTIDSLGGLRPWLAPRPVGDTTPPTVLGGAIAARAAITGWLRELGVAATIEGSDLRVGTTTVRAAHASARLEQLQDSASGPVIMRLDTLRSGTFGIASLDARLRVTKGNRARGRVLADALNGVRLRSTFSGERHGDSISVVNDTLDVEASANQWSLAVPARLALASGGFRLDTLALRARDGARIDGSISLPSSAPIALALRGDSVALRDLGEFAQSASALSGRTSWSVSGDGTRQTPRLLAAGRVDGGAVAGVRLDDVRWDARYGDERLRAALGFWRGGRESLRADVVLPLDLSLRAMADRRIEAPLAGAIRSDSVGLATLEGLTSQLRDASGALTLGVELSGTWKAPRLTGALSVRDGSALVPALGTVRLGGLNVDVAFLGDSIAVRRVAMQGDGGRGQAALGGWVRFTDLDDPQFDLRLTAESFRVLDKPRVATLDFSGDLRVAGAKSRSRLSGGLTVDRGTIYVPELYQKSVISLDDPEYYNIVDTTALGASGRIPAPSAFVRNLAVENVPIRLGDDVRLKSAEANILLGGFVNITRTSGLAANAPAQLALDGPLAVRSGTYRLNLGPVQRTFQVEGGTVRFYGDPELNPALSIDALHTVRQYSANGPRQDVRIRVRIGGTRLAPLAEFSSPDSLRVSSGDLISYLVTGAPSDEVVGGGDYGSTAARVLLSSVGSFVGSRATGGVCDDAQVSTAGLEGYGGRIRDVSGSILAGTRFNCAKRLSDRMSVRLDAGLCGVGQLLGANAATGSPLAFADAIGVKVDYRFGGRVTASGGVEPPTSATTCASSATARGFAPTPRQLSFDLFRAWQF